MDSSPGSITSRNDTALRGAVEGTVPVGSVPVSARVDPEGAVIAIDTNILTTP